MTLPRLLRGLAVAIVLLALLDPALTSTRRSDTVVAVVATGVYDAASGASRGGGLPAEVAAALSRSMVAVHGPWAGASATVLVGDGWPEGFDALPGPVFRVLAGGSRARHRIVGLQMPHRVPAHAAVPVELVLEAGGEGAPGDFEIRSGGLVLATLTPAPAGNPGFFRAGAEFVPPGQGPIVVEVAPAGGARDGAGAEPWSRAGDGATGGGPGVRRVVHVEDLRWQVLFLDTRPNWGSTFVRRALEEDPRFELSGRVETSPGLATTFGSPPASLAPPGALDPWEVVVVGASDGLTATQVAALEGWVGDRGGALVLLPDRLEPGTPTPAPWGDLAQIAAWERRVDDAEVPLERVGRVPAQLAGSDPPPLFLARELGWPRALPPGAVALATDDLGAPVIWRRPLGSGNVVVSGALDAWRFRDPDRSRFEPAWRELLAELAAAAPPPFELRLEAGRSSDRLPRSGAPGALRPAGGAAVAVLPGAPVHLVVMPRAAVQGAREPPGSHEIRIDASLEHASPVPSESEGPPPPLRLAPWPGTDPGSVVSDFLAPAMPGIHTVTVSVDGESASVPLVVLDPERDFEAPGPGGDPALLEAWSRSRGGAVFRESDMARLGPAIEAAVGAERRAERWHPMRSPWWLLPFALALGGEWWWRRRRGLP